MEKTVALGYIRREAGVPGREVRIGAFPATVVQLPIEELEAVNTLEGKLYG